MGNRELYMVKERIKPIETKLVGGISRWTVIEYVGEYVSFIKTGEFNMNMNKQAPIMTIYALSEIQLAEKMIDKVVGIKKSLVDGMTLHEVEEARKSLEQLKGYLSVTKNNMKLLVNAIAPCATREEIEEVEKSINC